LLVERVSKRVFRQLSSCVRQNLRQKTGLKESFWRLCNLQNWQVSLTTNHALSFGEIRADIQMWREGVCVGYSHCHGTGLSQWENVGKCP
jgi:hypothetical protein